VGGLQKTEFLSEVSGQIFQLAGNSPLTATLTTLWFTGIASAIVSNIAIALTFTPVITNFFSLNPHLPDFQPPVTSALILGTNLGGATTPLSGSVCIMAVGALKREGISMSFSEFTKVGIITSLLQLGFSSFYLIARFGLWG